MLRITQNSTAEGAKSYYSTADYYTEGQELSGVWRGEGSARLGLSGSIDKGAWEALCDNRDPATGGVLTPRQKRDRRVGYDFNFHVPKSVSVLYGLTRDDRILEAFRDSVNATMEDMEVEMKTRVRAGGRNEDRQTGNMVWGEFVHFTARPVDGVPDPHLHAHCFVFNTTWDERESRWKAGQFAGIKRDAPFFEAVFHSRLGRRLEELGLPVERTKRGWELSGIPDSAIQKFSRRTALIEEKAREKGITDAEAKGELGARTRERKRSDLSLEALREEWTSRLTQEELDSINGVKGRLGEESITEDDRVAGEAVRHAVDHCFERSSVVPERKVLTEALKRSVGSSSPELVTRTLGRERLVSAERGGQRLVTTKEVLAEERGMIDFARGGRGACRALSPAAHQFKREWLNAEQRRAVEHVLHSRDRVVLIRGAAGTGKTSLMQEAVEAIEATGKKVFTCAPSADASRGVLRSEGFADAETVARLLKDERMQAGIRGQVVWIDEAGLLGTRTMADVFTLARKMDARVVLSGDRRQHGSVERGAALRLLEEQAGLVPAEVTEIQRQRGDYKQAVRALSEGRIDAGFEQLDRLGWIREVPQAERYKALASEYVATVEAGKTALIVSPTHLEGEWISDEVRSRLKQSGRLGTGERRFTTLESSNLTEAEREDPVNYSRGDVLVYHQNAQGVPKGSRVVVGNAPVPVGQAKRFQVYHPNVMPIAPGDVIRITRNGTSADGVHRLNNGARYSVRGFSDRGDIVLANGWTISKDFGHLTHGYCVTSHKSQGTTVDRVFIGASSISRPASSREQFYVSVSRGREQATVYTDDKESLMEAVGQSDERLSATEVLGEQAARERAAAIQRVEQAERLAEASREGERGREGLNHDR